MERKTSHTPTMTYLIIKYGIDYYYSFLITAFFKELSHSVPLQAQRAQIHRMCWFMEISMKSHHCYELPLGKGIKDTKQMENRGDWSRDMLKDMIFLVLSQFPNDKQHTDTGFLFFSNLSQNWSHFINTRKLLFIFHRNLEYNSITFIKIITYLHYLMEKY